MRDWLPYAALVLSGIGATISAAFSIITLRTARRLQDALRSKEGLLPPAPNVEEEPIPPAEPIDQDEQ